MDFVLSLCLGIGLSAACGFRVFVPMLGMSVASMAEHLELSSGFEWIGTLPAFVCFLAATSLEIVAYYVPWLDNLLDTIATPAAIVAGTITLAATVGPNTMVAEMSPLLRWTLALIAGGSIAGIIQLGTVTLRGTSTLTTAGLGNFIVSTLELVLSVATTVLAFALPILCVVAVVPIAVLLVRRRFVRRKVLVAESTVKIKG
ncbi:MAG: DUF4126 domain-containing protein [Planctomycetales bacterium]|nr:DUF4126 domain-containing protein [Planctomycetales bacterium]